MAVPYNQDTGSYNPSYNHYAAKRDNDTFGVNADALAGSGADQSVQDQSLGGWYSTVMGGQNTYQVTSPRMDPYAFMYGGNPNSAKMDRSRLIQEGNASQLREGADLYGSAAGIDYNASRMANAQSRVEQQQGLDAYRQAMNGQAPSVAQQQLVHGLGAAQMAAASTAASARGGGANLAAAQRTAAQQQGQLAGQTNDQAAQLRANEIAQARQGFGGLSTSMRGQDQANSGMMLNAANAQMGATMNQRQLNDQRQMGMERQAYDITRAQQEGNSAFQKGQADLGMQAQQANRQTNSENAKASEKGLMGMIGGFMSDMRAKEDIQPVGDQQVGKSLHNAAYGDFNFSKQPATAPQDDGGGMGMLGGMGGGKMMGMLSDKQAKEDARQVGRMEMAHALGAVPRASMADVYGGTVGQAQRQYGPRPIESANPYANPVASKPLSTWGGVETPAEPSEYERQRAADIGASQYGKEAGSIQNTLDKLKAYEYKYKEPEKFGEGKRVGIMAQDLEKSPLGAQAVMDTPNGKAIDANKALSLSLAANANLNDRLNALEEKRGLKSYGRAA